MGATESDRPWEIGLSKDIIQGGVQRIPQQVPKDKAFSRMVKRFKETGNVHTEKPPGPVKTKTT